MQSAMRGASGQALPKALSEVGNSPKPLFIADQRYITPLIQADFRRLPAPLGIEGAFLLASRVSAADPISPHQLTALPSSVIEESPCYERNKS